MGRLKFNDTKEGRIAEGMVSRGEIAGISAGYRVEAWEIADADGTVIDPEKDTVRWDDDLTFTATRWELLECSLVCVPAESTASVRSLGGDHHTGDIAERILVRTRMHARQPMHDAQARVIGLK
jgi:phage head maturation protease